MAHLWERSVAEALGMMVVISVGNGAIANEVLKKTKGHDLGLGFVAIAYGMAFFLGISMFGHLSASLNPAMHLAKALIGRQSWKDSLVLSLANVFGGFLGGVMVYGLYFAHFSIVPQRPRPPEWDDALIDASYAAPSHTRNAYISYEPRHRSLTNEERQKVVFRYKAKGGPGVDGAIHRTAPLGGVERSNSMQVATILHEREKAKDPIYTVAEEGEEQLADADDGDEAAFAAGFTPAQGQHVLQARSTPPSERRRERPGGSPVQGSDNHESERGHGLAQSVRAPPHGGRKPRHQGAPHLPPFLARRFQFGGVQLHETAALPAVEVDRELERDGITKKDIAVYHGMLVADQNAKLAAFASRPAVLNYTANTVAEIIGTFCLIWFALMLEERVHLLDTSDAAENLMPILSPLLIGFLVVGLVTGQAGPTGFTSNPSRDLGPRIAHFVLPIPNKGPSEWYYAFVPILGPLIGGFLGAAAFYGCIQLNDYPPWFEGETSVFGGSWEL